MRVWTKCRFVVIALISLTLVCGRPVNAKDPVAVDEISALAIATNENLVAIDAEAKQADSDLKIIAASINTRLSEFNLSHTKFTELLSDFARETREDRKAESMEAARVLVSKALKLRADNEAIAQGLKEAAEKAERAMAAAQMEFYLGVVSGLMKVSAATNALTQGDTPGFTNLLRSSLPNVNFEVLEIRKDIGITIRVRVGKAISCLSSKQQCSGRSYLISK